MPYSLPALASSQQTLDDKRTTLSLSLSLFLRFRRAECRTELGTVQALASLAIEGIWTKTPMPDVCRQSLGRC